MNLGLKSIVLSVGIAAMSSICHAQETLFWIRGGDVSYAVTEAVVEKVGTLTYEAMVPGMDDRLHEVRGPLIRDLLREAGISGKTATGIALDKYEAEIPASDFDKFDVIAAIELDGKRLTVRNKGPAWIVYPSGEHENMRKDPVYEARSIWQLKELVLK